MTHKYKTKTGNSKSAITSKIAAMGRVFRPRYTARALVFAVRNLLLQGEVIDH
jgi:hypothetical protein